MPKASLYALIGAYQAQIEWLITQATELECGERKITGQLNRHEIDLSEITAAEYRHRAGNMQAILEAYERLHAKGT